MARLFPIFQLFFRKRLLPLYIVAMVGGCANPEEENLSQQRKDFPSRVLINAEVIFKDSGFLKIDLRSPLIEEYAMIDSPYTKFPKGLEMNYYNKNLDSPVTFRANTAVMNDMKGWYEGRGDVLVISEQGDTLKTQKLFWNKVKRQVFTRDTVYIITKHGDSLQANNGLEAKDDLTEYMLFNNQGTKFLEDEKL